MKFGTMFNHTITPEKPRGISMTIPNQAMTVREILERYARGLPFEAGKIPIYQGENDGDQFHNFDRMELTDQMDFIRANAARVEKLTKEQNERVQSDMFETEVNKRLAAKEAKKGPNEPTEPSTPIVP